MSVVETKPGLRDLTADMFHSAIGATFVFRRPVEQQSACGEYVELKLLEVKGFSRTAVNFRAPFSLLFELPGGMPPLGPGLHRIEHRDFLREDWHIARVQVLGRDPGKEYYESVFG